MPRLFFFKTGAKAKTKTSAIAGFSLIELLAVVSISSVIMITVTQLFIVSLSNRAKVNIRKEIKAEGTYVLNQLEFLIRNATPPLVCTGNNDLILQSSDSLSTTLSTTTDGAGINRIASNSAYLTSDAVDVQNLAFECVDAANGSGQYINLSFDLYYVGDTSTTIVSEKFKTGIQVRNTTGIL